MGVYIKGMEMPKCCGDCDFLYDFFGCMETWESMALIDWELGKKRLPNCPLVEVPDHGDLIDRETIVDSVCNGVCSCSECSFNQNPFDSCVLQTNLEKLKVVIPAEKAKNDLEVVE